SLGLDSRKPASGREGRWAAGHADDSVDSKLPGELDRGAEVGVVAFDLDRVSGDVERREPEPAGGEPPDEARPLDPVREELVEPAVGGRGVATRPDLEVAQGRHLSFEPREELVERQVLEAVGEETDPHASAGSALHGQSRPTSSGSPATALPPARVPIPTARRAADRPRAR